MSEDRRLLQEYEGRGSRAALEELVGRHLGLVYSSALRQVRDAHLAEDVTQAVFLVLTQKGRTIRRGEAVGGWLLAVTRAVSVNAMKKRATQKKHEVQAAKPEAAASPLDQWENIAPQLDGALHGLAARDRDAIVLRFFQDRSFASIGAEMGLSEEAARKRVSRALERLRGVLMGRNVSLDAGALSGVIGAFAVHAPPASLSAGSIAVSIAAPSPVSISLTKGALKMLQWTKVKVAAGIVATAVAASLGAILVTQEFARQPSATVAVAATENESNPGETADATKPAASVADAAAKPIFMDARLILMSPTLRDDFRVGWDINMGGNGTNGANMLGNKSSINASIIDNWTLNILLSLVQKDEGSEVIAIPKIIAQEGSHYDLNLPEKDPLVTIRVKPRIGRNGRYVAMFVAPALNSPAAPLDLVIEGNTKPRILDLDPSAVEDATMVEVPDGGTLLIDGGMVSAPLHDATIAPGTKPAPRRMLILLQPTIENSTQTTRPQ